MASRYVAWIAGGGAGAVTVDIADPPAAALIAVGADLSEDVPGAFAMRVVGGSGFTFDSDLQLAVIDTCDPAAPALVDTLQGDVLYMELQVGAGYAYATTSSNGLDVIDLDCYWPGGG